MADAGVAPLFGNLVLESLDHAFIDGLDLVAGAADQVMVMMMAITRANFMPGRSVDPGDPLHELFFFEDRNEPEDGGEIAAFRAHLLVDIGQGEGNRAGIEQSNDGNASMGGTQAVFPQPRCGVDGVRSRMCAHTYLYHYPIVSESLSVSSTLRQRAGLARIGGMSAATAISHTDGINARILAISEDRIAGFVRDPMQEIARGCELSVDLVIKRIRAMLRAGTIRRVRQTLMATDLAPGALVAWEVDADKIDAGFEYMFQHDPFSGHVVLRSTDAVTAGSQYKLWTTLKVPHGFSMRKHAEFLRDKVGARHYRLMPARGIFALGVGHTRRKSMEPGSKSDGSAEMHAVRSMKLTELEWRVLMTLKREFTVDEITENLWEPRAREADLPLPVFFEVAESLDERKVIGRFSTFLEHVKPTGTGERVTRFNALFHWAVPAGREIEAGREIGRHHILTHCYWREGGPEFNHVNVMAVAHGTDRDLVRAHKTAIDEHLRQIDMPFSYTNVFWGGRSEIKPSEIAPAAYADWCRSTGIDPEAMRED